MITTMMMMMMMMMMIIGVFNLRRKSWKARKYWKVLYTTGALVSWDSKEGSLKYALNYWNGWG